MTLNPQKWGFGQIFPQFLVAAHISGVNCDEMAGDGPKQSVHEIFNIKHRF